MDKIVTMKSTHFLIVLGLLIFSNLCALQKKNILIIHSYHRGYLWTENMERGIIRGLNEKGIDFNLYVEYLDSKRYPGILIEQVNIKTLILKYKDLPIDAVITTDDNAYGLLLNNRTIFSNIPIFACGLNKHYANNNPNVYLFYEDIDVATTLSMIAKIQPELQNLLVIIDSTTTGQLAKQQIKSDLSKGKYAFNTRFYNGMDLSTSTAIAKSLPPNSAIILISVLYDKKQLHPIEYCTSYLSQHSTIPIYGIINTMIGKGALGGRVFSGYEHGRLASHFVAAKLKGEKLPNPIQSSLTNKTIFDYNQMLRFNISEKALPPNSIIINAPVRFMDRYKEYLIIFLLVILILSIVIVILVTNILLRRKAENILKQREQQLSAILNSNSILASLKTKDLKYVHVNPLFQNLLDKNVNAIGKSVFDALPKEVANMYYLHDTEVLQKEKTLNFEEVVFLQGKEHTFLTTRYPILDSKGEICFIGMIATDITERKFIENMLESEKRFISAVLDTMNAYLLIINEEGIIVRENNMFSELCPYNDSYEKDYFWLRFGPQFEEQYLQLWDTINSNKKSLSIKLPLITSRSQQKNIDWQISTIDQINNNKYFVLIGIDITEETLLKLQKNRFFDISVDIFCITDPLGNINEINQACTRITGWEISDLLGQNAKDFIHPDDYLAIMQSISGIDISLKTAFEFQSRFITNSGTYRWLACSVFYDHSKELCYVSARDFTDERIIKDELLISEERARTQYQNIPVPTYTWKRIGNEFILVDYNELAFEQPHPSLSYKGIKASELFANNNEILRDMERCFDLHDTIHKEYQYQTQDYDGIKYSMISFAFVPPDSVMVHSEDISKRKNMEIDLKKYSTDLEKVNDELRSFAYIVSHDLKAPLRAISSLVDWLDKDYRNHFDCQGVELLSLLKSRARRMHDLIEGILQFSRVGRIVEEKKETDLQQLVNSVIEMLSPPNHIKVVQLNTLPILCVEPVHLAQVFQNLISNAIKFLDKEQGLIEIGCQEEEALWLFSVKDNGPGIEERFYDKVFQIFQTLKPRDEFESTGIGLTIVKKIIENYGGTIWIDSKVGKETTFFFTLPK